MLFHDTPDRNQIENVGFAAGSIKSEFLHNATDDVVHIVLREQLLALEKAAEFFAARQSSRGIDRPRLSFTSPFDLAIQFVSVVALVLDISPPAAQIEVLKSEAQRINFLVANRTIVVLLMLD